MTDNDALVKRLEAASSAVYLAAHADVAHELSTLLREAAAVIKGPEGSVDVLLFCPACKSQHIDMPEPEKGWANPPHKSHLCHNCQHIWRAADVPTNGTPWPKTRGNADTFPPKETE